jgi:hypothetical protein
MMIVVEFLLVGRSPLGSAIRAVVVALLMWQFWRLFISEPWTLFIVSLITALVIVVAAHLLSRRDSPVRAPEI